MANTFVNVVSDNKTLELPCSASIAISIGDLCYWDSAAFTAKPISSLTTGASEIIDQEQVAVNFVGVAGDARLSTETSTGADSKRLFICDGIFDITLFSDTFHLGNFVGATWNGGAALANQVIRKVASEDLAIGRVVREPASGDLVVRCRLQSRVAFDLFSGPIGLGGRSGLAATTLADSNQTLTLATNSIINEAPTAARTHQLPDPVAAGAIGKMFYFTNNSGGANSVTFQQSAAAIKGNGVVPQNKTGIFWSDGTNWNGSVSA